MTLSKIESNNIQQTMEAGAALVKTLTPGAVVGLIGELGAGKTQFVRGMAAGLGINPKVVSSPTFILMQEYEAENYLDDTPSVLVHIDAYRLGENHNGNKITTNQALSTIGWEDNGKELRQGAIVAVEWANLISESLDKDTIYVTLTHRKKGRYIEINNMA